MAVPRAKHSKSRKRKRRSHHHAKVIQRHYCVKCGEANLPHRICPNCGWFQGREVVETVEEE